MKLYSLLCRQLLQRAFHLFRPGMTRSTREKEPAELVLQTGRNVSNQTGKVTDKKMHILQPNVFEQFKSYACASYAFPPGSVPAMPFSCCCWQNYQEDVIFIDSDLASRRLMIVCFGISVLMAARQKTTAVSLSSCGRACFAGRHRP